MLTKAPRGTKDILPGEVGAWTHVERVIRGLCDRYGYKEIRTPHFEHTELFQRGIGDGTDVVDKEMYTFTDRGDRGLTLRPENTAAAIRASWASVSREEPSGACTPPSASLRGW